MPEALTATRTQPCIPRRTARTDCPSDRDISTSADRRSYGCQGSLFGGAGYRVMGHSAARASSSSGRAVPKVFGSDGPAVRSKDNRLVSGSSRARSATPDLAAHDVRVELAGDVALQDAHDLGVDRPSAVRRVAHIPAGAFITAHAREHDPPQGMVCRRFPPGFSRCRLVFPDDAWSGATPQRCATWLRF